MFVIRFVLSTGGNWGGPNSARGGGSGWKELVSYPTPTSIPTLMSLNNSQTSKLVSSYSSSSSSVTKSMPGSGGGSWNSGGSGGGSGGGDYQQQSYGGGPMRGGGGGYGGNQRSGPYGQAAGDPHTLFPCETKVLRSRDE
ncbi:hypothetical protein WDU94_013759 [Cyamophila willieti]